MPTPTIADDGAMTTACELVLRAIKGNQAGFGIEFKAERSYADWDLKLDEADELRVDVVPVRHAKSELSDRGSVDYTCTMDIGIRQRFEAEYTRAVNGRIEIGEIDRLVKFQEHVLQFLCDEDNRTLADNVAWESAEIRATYIPKHLREFRQYTSLMRVAVNVHVEL